MTFDESENLLIYLKEGSGGTEIKRYDANTFNFIDEITVPGLSDDAASIDCYGANSYVFSTQDNELVFVEYQPQQLGVNEQENISNTINIFPNPTIESFSILGIKNIQGVKIFNVLEKLVKTFSKTRNYNISMLNSGTYFISIYSNDGDIITKKIIKKY